MADAHAHRFRHTFATWAIENHAREIDVQYLLGHSTSAMVRRYSATYDAAKARGRACVVQSGRSLTGDRLPRLTTPSVPSIAAKEFSCRAR